MTAEISARYEIPLIMGTISPESEDSPGSVSAGESHQEKGGQQFFSRDVEVLFGKAERRKDSPGIGLV